MRLAPLLAMCLLSACSPEGFEITACSLDGRLAFRLHEIDGWLRDYQPRPQWVVVKEAARRERPGAIWSGNLADANERPAREIIVYGQLLSGWELEAGPQKLRDGVQYVAMVKDGGRWGETRFIAGQPLRSC